MADLLGLFKGEHDLERHPAGTVVIAAGEPPRCMYVVRSGQLAIRVGARVLETVGPGDVVGEMALVDQGERSASVEAVTECELVPIDQRRFVYLVQQTPFFALQVMRTMAARLRAMNERAARGIVIG